MTVPIPSAATPTATCATGSLETALTYARMGWRVLPVHNVQSDGLCSCGGRKAKCANNPDKNRGKHPRITSWQTLATTNEATIEEWFRQWLHANVGIATGRESGIVVIDVDDYKADGGQLARLEERFGELPDTTTQTTGNGGRQLFFRY